MLKHTGAEDVASATEGKAQVQSNVPREPVPPL
jgi:hypothetical protein